MTASLYAQLLTYTNPFCIAATHSNGQDLWNIATHTLVLRKVVPQTLGAFELGEMQRQAFQSRLTDGKLFWDTPMKRNNLPTLGPVSTVKRKKNSASLSLASTSAVLYEIMTRALTDPDRNWTAEKLLPWSLIELPRLKADAQGNALLEDSKAELVEKLKKDHGDFGKVAAAVVALDDSVPVALCVDLGQTFVRQSVDHSKTMKTCGDYVNRVVASPIKHAQSRTVNIGRGRVDLHLCGELHPDSLLHAPPVDGALASAPVVVSEHRTPESAYEKCKCEETEKNSTVLLCDGPCEGEYALCCLGLSAVPDAEVWYCPECKESLDNAAAASSARFSPRNIKIGTHLKRVGSEKLPVEYAKVFADLPLNGAKLGDILRSTHNKVLFNRLLLEQLESDGSGLVLEFLKGSRGGSTHVTCLDQAFRLHLSADNSKVVRSEEPSLRNNLPEADHRLDTCGLHFANAVPDTSGWRSASGDSGRGPNSPPSFERKVGAAVESSDVRPLEMYRGLLFSLVEDTDCLCSAMSLNHRMQHVAHGSLFGKGKGVVACDTHAMSDGLGRLAARAFRALHILSGNDEVSKTRTKGKRSWLSVFLKLCEEGDDCVTEGLLKLGTRDWTDLQMREPEFQTMVKHLTTLCLRLFGVEKSNTQVKTLTDCRIWQYTRAQGKKKDLADLVETENQWLWHCLRANFSAFVWTCGASLPPRPVPNPTGRGWSTRTNPAGKLVLVPRWSSEPALPPSLANTFSCVSCGQSAAKQAATDGSVPAPGCATKRCVCHSRGAKCTHLCGCVNCANPHGVNDTTVTLSTASGAFKGGAAPAMPPPPPFVQLPVDTATGDDADAAEDAADAVAVEHSTLEEDLAELAAAEPGPGELGEEDELEEDAFDGDAADEPDA